MIQRIQTLWLALAVLCMVLCFTLPLASYSLITVDGTEHTARFGLVQDSSEELQQITDNPMPMHRMATWPLIALAMGTMLVSLVAIFFYHNRVLQMRVVAMALLLCMAYIALVFIWAVDAYGKLATDYLKSMPAQTTWMAGSFVPLAALVLLVLAQRSIKRDENKVRAADRLR